MRRCMMKSKIHRATVTAADPQYVGSITVDAALMATADLLAHEKVHLLDIDNGVRLETYVIAGEAGSGVVAVNGAAARLVDPGDKVIILSYTELDDAEAHRHVPTVVFVDGANRVTHVGPEIADLAGA